MADRLFILPLRPLRATTRNDAHSDVSYHLYGNERVGREVFIQRVEGNKVYFKFADEGPMYWANSGEFRDATGNEKKVKKLVRHQDKMFFNQLWGGGRTAAKEGGLPKWCIS
jgi:hypothetical protein